MHTCSVTSVVFDSLWPHGLYSLPGSSVHEIFQAVLRHLSRAGQCQVWRTTGSEVSKSPLSLVICWKSRIHSSKYFKRRKAHLSQLPIQLKKSEDRDCFPCGLSNINRNFKKIVTQDYFLISAVWWILTNSKEGLMLKLKLQYFTWCEELTHSKRPCCWERLRAGEEGDRGWDGWMASLTQWTWTGANSRRWWGTGKPGVLQSMGLWRVRHNLGAEQQQSKGEKSHIKQR